MSDHAANVIWLTVAAVNAIITGWKTRAFFREPTLTLALISASFLISVFVFLSISPWGSEIIGRALGKPSFATLPAFVGILACYAITHVLTMLWTPPPASRRRLLHRQVIAWTVAYTGASAAMTVLFLLADLNGRGNVIRFNVENASDPYIQGFLALFLGMLACGTLSTWWRARSTEISDERIQHVLRWFSASMLFVCGYVVFNIPAIISAASGDRSLDGFSYIGQSFGAFGALCTSYGMSGAATHAWFLERRDIRVLKPLWKLAYGDRNRGLAHTSVRFALHRRIIETLDGMRELSFFARAELAEEVKSLAGGDLPRSQVEAIATAVMLRDAAMRISDPDTVRLKRASALSASAVRFPGDHTAASEQRARLLDVARALRHPLTIEVTELITAEPKRLHDGPPAPR
ncbi:DUF6545 domain-containing protein [Streptomyces sp. NPDC090093]|uniref:DUF6545 domain-containing protein n=1 Tax=Streptomyces sp. NPDC090093 TaxID=3365945 RepID=UPI00380853D0